VARSACLGAALCWIAPHAEAASPLIIAQNFGAPPADVGDDYSSQAQPESSSLLVRIDRLESQMRQLNGQIEQLQFQNRKLEDQLKKFQEDVDFRLRDSGRAPSPASAAKPQKRSDAIESLIGADESMGSAAPSASATPPSPRPARRGDAFDPASDPTAPGAPRPLGSVAQSSPAARPTIEGGLGAPAPEAPLDLSGSKWRAGHTSGQLEPSAPIATPADSSVAALTTPNSVQPGAAPINPVKEEFDVAYGYFRQKEYESAENSFKAFIQKNPKSRMTADATYYLGESFFQRNRPREAAEQYLKISTQYATSARAAEAMLRLGQSLNALGAKEQACATFAEIGRKYPNASTSVKAGAEREAKRVQC
jgi:tol-pal system protein YbgF